jgi:regulator of sigma E protease
MVPALISLLILGFLVIVHELGHLVVARRAGVRILRFSIGFGPKLFGWTRHDTEYTVSAIPLGGYVKMAGEQRTKEAYEPWEYLSKPIGTRAAIVFAGPLVNYLVAVVSLWTVFMIGYPELLPVVGKVMEAMPARLAGLQPKDRIRAVDGRAIRTWEEMTKVIYASPDRSVTLRVERNNELLDVSLTPRPRKTMDLFGRSKRIGLIGIAPSGDFEPYRVGPVAAFRRTMSQHWEWTTQTLLSLWSMVRGRMSLRESVTGPIGIIYLTSEAIRLGIAPLLFLISLFSLSLAIFNLFPIPILDGGHLFFLGVEKLRGRPLSVLVQERSAQVSFVFLLTFVLMICINDLSRFGVLDKVLGWFRR